MIWWLVLVSAQTVQAVSFERNWGKHFHMQAKSKVMYISWVTPFFRWTFAQWTITLLLKFVMFIMNMQLSALPHSLPPCQPDSQSLVPLKGTFWNPTKPFISHTKPRTQSYLNVQNLRNVKPHVSAFGLKPFPFGTFGLLLGLKFPVIGALVNTQIPKFIQGSVPGWCYTFTIVFFFSFL